jgi:hypothetical protein
VISPSAPTRVAVNRGPSATRAARPLGPTDSPTNAANCGSIVLVAGGVPGGGMLAYDNPRWARCAASQHKARKGAKRGNCEANPRCLFGLGVETAEVGIWNPHCVTNVLGPDPADELKPPGEGGEHLAESSSVSSDHGPGGSGGGDKKARTSSAAGAGRSNGSAVSKSSSSSSSASSSSSSSASSAAASSSSSAAASLVLTLSSLSSSSSSSVAVQRAPGKTGLGNLGATCYINCLLQALFHNPRFRCSIYQWRRPDAAFVSQMEDKAVQQLDILEAMQLLFARMHLTVRCVALLCFALRARERTCVCAGCTWPARLVPSAALPWLHDCCLAACSFSFPACSCIYRGGLSVCLSACDTADDVVVQAFRSVCPVELVDLLGVSKTVQQDVR